MKTRDFYAHISERYYEETFGTVVSLRAFQRGLRTEAVLQLLDRYLPGSALVADVGCGPAQYARPLLGLGHRYVGIDLAPAMFQQTAAEFASNHDALFKEGSIEQIPLEDSTVDAAIVIGVFEYLESDERALEEVVRILNPGGLVIITLPNVWNLVHALRTALRPIVAPAIRLIAPRSRLAKTVFVSSIPYRVFRPAAFVAKAAQRGLVLKDEHFHGFSFYPLDRAITPEYGRKQIERERRYAGSIPRLGSNYIACFAKS